MLTASAKTSTGSAHASGTLLDGRGVYAVYQRSDSGPESLLCGIVEATTGFEPVNRGFADPRVEPLHHVAPSGVRRVTARCWLPLEDSNLGSRIQSPLSYH
jgi:hypothetical protein